MKGKILGFLKGLYIVSCFLNVKHSAVGIYVEPLGTAPKGDNRKELTNS